MNRDKRIGIKSVKEVSVSLRNNKRIAYLLLSYLFITFSVLVSRDIWGDTATVILFTTIIYTIYFVLIIKLRPKIIFTRIVIFYIFVLSLVCLPNILSTVDDGIQYNIYDSLISLTLNSISIIFIYFVERQNSQHRNS